LLLLSGALPEQKEQTFSVYKGQIWNLQMKPVTGPETTPRLKV